MQFFRMTAMIAVMFTGIGSNCLAANLEYGGKLLLTRGISNLSGGGGGALTPWALITGNETDRGIGGTAHYTYVATNDFEVRTFGGALGLYDRFEVSYTSQAFDT